MKKSILYLFLSFMFIGFVGCSGEATTTEVQTTESPYSITVEVGDSEYVLGYDDGSQSVFELIEASDINLDYIQTDFGPMVTAIGNLEQDDLHWIGFLVNGEFATSGLSELSLVDGDVYTFSQNLSTWEMTLTVDYIREDTESYYFEYDVYTFIVDKADIINLSLIEEESYELTFTPESESNQSLTVTVSEISENFEGYIVLRLGDSEKILTYDNSELSVLEIIESSEVHLEYTTSEYGAMISEIGAFKQDDFHWIGFTKNGEFAMSGVDSIDYVSGDVFEFTENLSTWEISFSAELIDIVESAWVFQSGEQVFHTNILTPEVEMPLVIGYEYAIIGTMTASSTDENMVFDIVSIEVNAISDFTELYTLEEGDVFILEFTVSYVEDSLEFGTEIFAEDVNDLSSTEISGYMSVPSNTDYVFYTIPDGVILEVGTSYYGKFIYQVNEPSTIPQITIYNEVINGETMEVNIIAK